MRLARSVGVLGVAALLACGCGDASPPADAASSPTTSPAASAPAPAKQSPARDSKGRPLFPAKTRENPDPIP